jgi:hypothetical protein
MPHSMPLESWSSFYVIVGSSAGGLTGLTFVVIALIADAHVARLSGMRAYISPTVVHFCSVLGIAALLNIPGHTPWSIGLCIGASGLIGVFYSIGTTVHLHRNRPRYVPETGDWIWNALLPTLCYLILLIAGMLAPLYVRAALYATAAVSLLLLLIGIHNAWDIAVWFTAGGRAAESAGASKPPAPSQPPPT